MEKPYHFIGNNCKLRPLSYNDKNKTLLWKNDSSIRDMQLGYVFPVTEAMEDKWFENIISPKDNKNVFFTIDYNDETAGFVSLRDIDWISKHAQFSISIGKEYQGKGIGKETLNFMLDYGFNILNLNKIYLRVVEINTIAKKLYENAGFVVEGKMREHAFINGNYYDVIIMSKLKKELCK